MSKPPAKRRTTRWERQCDGLTYRRGRGFSQQDVDAVSLSIRRTSRTSVDEQGRIRGEASDAIIEERRWADL